DHLGARRDAELVVEARRRNLAQRLLGEHRDAPPDLQLVHTIQIERRHAAPPEIRVQRTLYRQALALAVDALDLGLRLGPAKIRAGYGHPTLSSKSSSPPTI